MLCGHQWVKLYETKRSKVQMLFWGHLARNTTNNGFCLEVVMVLNIVCLSRVLWITKRIMGNIVVESSEE